MHGDYRLGNTMFADDAPAKLIAIFDWEMATIGDPLADVGYLTATWSEPERAADTMFDAVGASPRARASRRATSWSRATRSAPAARCPTCSWYQALALWKAAVFMEGNYKRSLVGQLRRPVPEALRRGRAVLAEAAGADQRWLDE